MNQGQPRGRSLLVVDWCNPVGRSLSKATGVSIGLIVVERLR